MQSVKQDLRYAFRMLARTPVVTTLIVLSLAIGIGANSAIFSVVHALLLRRDATCRRSAAKYPVSDRWLYPLLEGRAL